MASNKTLLVLPGDGIGPEVMREVRRVIEWMDRRRSVSFNIVEGFVGGAAIEAEGSPCPDSTVAAIVGGRARRVGGGDCGAASGPHRSRLRVHRPSIGPSVATSAPPSALLLKRRESRPSR